MAIQSHSVSWQSTFQLPNSGLKAYFGHVRSGQSEVYKTNFGGKETPASKILDEWSLICSRVGRKWPSLWKFENDLRAKVGPMSVMLPLKDRMKDIDHYYEDISLPQVPVSPTALAAVVSEWNRCRGINLRSQMATVASMKVSTNSGSPYFTKRRRVIKDTIPCITWQSGPIVLQSLNDVEWNAAAVLGWRGQEGGPDPEDVKQRVVWMFPFGVNIRELQFYQPAIECAQRFNIVPAWVSMEAVDERITKLFDTKNSHDLIVCTDFSKFDQHFNPSLQSAAHMILRDLMANGVAEDEWLENVFPLKYHMPLAYDWNKIRLGPHGMGSGSGGTNFDETLSHRALQHEAAQAAGETLNPNSMCLGDDGILTYPGISVEQIVESYTRHGLEMNTDKQEAATDHCTYLRRWHHSSYRVNGICVGVYSTFRALGRLMYQERYYDPEIWGPKAVALRQLSIMENVKFHPLREEFVEFCMKRDAYRLGIDIPGFLDNLRAEADKLIDVMPDFLGYTKSMQSGSSGSSAGIDSWWIVQYLRRRIR